MNLFNPADPMNICCRPASPYYVGHNETPIQPKAELDPLTAVGIIVIVGVAYMILMVFRK